MGRKNWWQKSRDRNSCSLCYSKKQRGITTTGMSHEDSECLIMSGFTNEQVQCLLSPIKSPKLSHERLSGNMMWILDTGVSSNMIAKLDALEKLENPSRFTNWGEDIDITSAKENAVDYDNLSH